MTLCSFIATHSSLRSRATDLQLAERLSMDVEGAAKCLGFQTSRGADLDDMISTIERRITDDTVLNVLS